MNLYSDVQPPALEVGGPGEIFGLNAQAPAASITTGKPVDRIGPALTDLKAAGWNPSVIVMNPRDWFAIESERANDGDGQYVIGTPRDPAPPSLWGTPVVVTMGMPELGALILDTTTTALLDRQEVTVEASRMDGDNFRRNLVTILAELRAGALQIVLGILLIVVGAYAKSPNLIAAGAAMAAGVGYSDAKPPGLRAAAEWFTG